MATTYQGYTAAFTSYTGSAVGACRALTIIINHGTIDDTVFGDKWKGTTGGQGSWSFEGVCILDLADVGQLAMTTAIAGATPTQAPATVVFALHTGKTLTGTAVITRWSYSAAATADNKVEVVFAGEGDGQPVIA